MVSNALATLLALMMACGAGAEERNGHARRDERARRGDRVLYGKAAWYGAKHHGKKTASGERFDRRKLTAAHRTLPFGTRVRVTNLSNGKSVVVRINDRGPFGKRSRVIDVSEAAARKLGMLSSGVVRVKLEILDD